MQKSRIPAHIKYPGMVVLLLIGTVVSQMFLLRAALSNKGPQVEQDYYQRAVDWDQEAAARAAFTRSGLRVATQYRRVDDGGTELLFVIRDAKDAPAQKMRGEVKVQHLAQAAPLYEGALEPVAERPGVYRARVPQGAQGLWDADLTLTRGDEQLQVRVRTEVLYE